MTLPAFKAVGAGHETSIPWPTHIAGDFALCCIEHHDGTISTPGGWTAVPGFPITTSVQSCRLSLFYRFATSAAESNFSVSGSSDHSFGAIATYTDVNQLNPFHLISTADNINATANFFPGLTTLLNDCLIVNVLGRSTDVAGAQSSAETNADLGSLTERFDDGTATGAGGGVVILDGTKAAKGAFTFTQVTLATSSASPCATLALQAAAQTFGAKSRVVNLGKQSMAILCNQSTAQEFGIFMADSADGKTGKTGLTLAITIKKGGDTSFSSISPTVTEIGNGNYAVSLTTTHMNTLGLVSLRATAALADPADCPNCIDVVSVDKQSATRGLAGTALPAVASGSAGAVVTAGTGTGQINVAGGRADADVIRWTGTAVAAPTTAGVPRVDVKAMEANVMTAAAAASDLTTEIQSGLATAANLATVAGYIDTEIATLVSNVTSILSATDTEVAAIKTKTDQLTFTVANQVDANALTGGGGATANDVRDAILNYEYRTGRTVRGLFRRIGAALEKATGLKGTLVSYFQPDGVTVEFTVPQSVTNGTRSAATVTNSETP